MKKIKEFFYSLRLMNWNPLYWRDQYYRLIGSQEAYAKVKNNELANKVIAQQKLLDDFNERTTYEMQFENHLQNNKKELFKAYYRERKRYSKKIGVID
ncbi:MAG: hypothetical protein WCY05_06295 [Candidatus Omnitrophota bacterium]